MKGRTPACSMVRKRVKTMGGDRNTGKTAGPLAFPLPYKVQKKKKKKKKSTRNAKLRDF